MSIQSAVFLPLLAAILYGLYYAVLGYVLQSVSMASFVFYNMALGLIIAAVFIAWRWQDFDIVTPARDWRLLAYIALGVLASWAAWLMTVSVIKNVNPTYAAIGEISYPIFVPIFAYLLFREKQWDWSMILGGGLIFAGLFILIWGRTKT